MTATDLRDATGRGRERVPFELALLGAYSVVEDLRRQLTLEEAVDSATGATRPARKDLVDAALGIICLEQKLRRWLQEAESPNLSSSDAPRAASSPEGDEPPLQGSLLR